MFTIAVVAFGAFCGLGHFSLALGAILMVVLAPVIAVASGLIHTPPGWYDLKPGERVVVLITHAVILYVFWAVAVAIALTYSKFFG